MEKTRLYNNDDDDDDDDDDDAKRVKWYIFKSK